MKTNKLKYIILSLAVSTIALVSCDNDLLETVPNDRLSVDVFWRTETDAKLAVNGLYTDLDSTNIISWDALTDIAHTNQNFDVQAYIELGTYDGTSSKVLGEWRRAYRGIRATSYFLENVDKVASTNTALINQLKGEAKVLRAYQYIKLAAFYGDVPLVTSSITIDEGRALVKSPVSAIWDFIDKELTEAAALLPTTYPATDKGRVTQGAALGLAARANLYAGRYQKAADAADKVMKLGIYGLYESYEKLFTYAAENNKEVLFDRQFIKDTYPINVFSILAPYSQKNGGSAYVPTKALVDMYETLDGKLITDAASGYNPATPYANRDTRLKYSVFLDGDILPSGIAFKPAPTSGTADAVGSTYIASTTGFNIKKYIIADDYANPVNSGINIILLRYAEILLTYAEAKIETGQIDASVLAAINAVRNGRNDVKQPSVTTLSQTELRTIVRRERTVELAFEGQHLFDIRRWKTAEKVIPGPVYGITYKDASGALATVQVVSVNKTFDVSRHYLWPVPQKERDLNPSLTQNPGW
ncbi:RagB/SusD family nutrient uptake outer membrane protein [Dyadobacter subterraneus]|uniref:RagB/SusD family nutrient uptake outer membrane protein n=1 Tax=Dyadobacter subterraneus TaxID=2773304 RepID=A0ABR9WM36_9BACT|nr:RagB/SusD family nutrient uptake outer membrane protein [Dyadobacter subterraneus]MBE9466575.1 RagB/SusD family nutrient uptake outer membrane protein [Dyadobacter subterraneus]